MNPESLSPAYRRGDEDAVAPYLSMVVTSRNDDHGGSLLRRMQTFVNAFISQSKRHSLSAELILVEWNPPADRPPLSEALRWPDDLGPCQVRIIQVPPEVHRGYEHADALPLYQMIAKNAGIRRARGRFVLATNIDILFNDELMRFLAGGNLRPDRMYRIDRYDVMADVPVDPTVEEQLAYCENHLLRINVREDTFPSTPTGKSSRTVGDLLPGTPQRVDVGAGQIRFGRGWYPQEQHFGELFRWANDNAELVVQSPGDSRRTLALELEPGPSAGLEPLVFQVIRYPGRLLGEVALRGRAVLYVTPPPSFTPHDVIRLYVERGSRLVPNDHRLLSFRIFQCQWVSRPAPAEGGVDLRPVRLTQRVRSSVRRCARLLRSISKAEGPLRIGVPFSYALVRRLGLRIDASGISMNFGLARDEVRRKRDTPRQAATTATAGAAANNDPLVLHTNACGDFTLLARDRWHALRGYPEFDAYSFNIDSLFCFAAHHAGVREEILEDPMRIYHIEHGMGSGWTPEGQAKLFERLAAKGIPYLDWSEVAAWADQMRRLKCPMIFNGTNWGLSEFALRETIPASTSEERQELT